MIKAIIVDDEPAVSSIISYFIKEDNMPIEISCTAENGKKAVELIKKAKPGLVFLDIRMPIMNGFEVMMEEPDIKYIIITAYKSFQYAQQALRLGAKDILLKPIEHKQFSQAVSRTLGWQFTNNTTVNSILEYIHEHYDQKIELITLSQIVYSTPSHISRVFKKHTGMNIIHYINNVRIKRATELLSKNKCSIKEAAALTGFNSLNNFYKYFKLFMGTTPAEFFCTNKKES